MRHLTIFRHWNSPYISSLLFHNLFLHVFLKNAILQSTIKLEYIIFPNTNYCFVSGGSMPQVYKKHTASSIKRNVLRSLLISRNETSKLLEKFKVIGERCWGRCLNIKARNFRSEMICNNKYFAYNLMCCYLFSQPRKLFIKRSCRQEFIHFIFTFEEVVIFCEYGICFCFYNKQKHRRLRTGYFDGDLAREMKVVGTTRTSKNSGWHVFLAFYFMRFFETFLFKAFFSK